MPPVRTPLAAAFDPYPEEAEPSPSSEPGALHSYGTLAFAAIPSSLLPPAGEPVALSVHRVGLDLHHEGTVRSWTWPEVASIDWAPRDESVPAPLPTDEAGRAFEVPLPFGTRVLWRLVGGGALVVRLPLVHPGQLACAARWHVPPG